MKKIILVFMIVVLIEGAKAQKIDFSIGGDFVSSYVWRGAYQTSAAIQPTMKLGVDGFSLSAWGSVPFKGEAKEVDFTAGYSVAGLSLAVTDYWWAGEGAYKYFVYESRETAHHFEGTLGYTLPFEKFPLSLSWNTMFAGEDYYKSDGKRAYSTYIEASYPFSVKDVGLAVSMGLTPWEGMYAADFSVINVSLKAEKAIKITDSFSLPIYAQLIANPRTEDIYFVFGVRL